MLWTARTALNFALQLVEFNQKNPRRRDRSLSPDRKRLSHKKILLFALAYVHHFVPRASMKQPVLLTSCGQVRSHYSHNTISRAATGLNMVAKKYYRSNFQCSYWNDICVMRSVLLLEGHFPETGFPYFIIMQKNTKIWKNTSFGRRVTDMLVPTQYPTRASANGRQRTNFLLLWWGGW